jgi:hypothetical protein
MWYHVAEGVAYAESADGLRWTKPRLGVIRVDGQDTNLLLLLYWDGNGNTYLKK